MDYVCLVLFTVCGVCYCGVGLQYTAICLVVVLIVFGFGFGFSCLDFGVLCLVVLHFGGFGCSYFTCSLWAWCLRFVFVGLMQYRILWFGGLDVWRFCFAGFVLGVLIPMGFDFYFMCLL